jgi:hypothetical protein
VALLAVATGTEGLTVTTSLEVMLVVGSDDSTWACMLKSNMASPMAYPWKAGKKQAQEGWLVSCDKLMCMTLKKTPWTISASSNAHVWHAAWSRVCENRQAPHPIPLYIKLQAGGGGGVAPHNAAQWIVEEVAVEARPPAWGNRGAAIPLGQLQRTWVNRVPPATPKCA